MMRAMDCRVASLAEWSPERVDGECRRAYAAYETEIRRHYTAYFADNRHLRCPRHSYSAATIAAALPPGWEHLQRLIPPDAFHRYARSGRSSQLLALALLGSCSVEDPSLRWLSAALEIPTRGNAGEICPFVFEHSLAPDDLGEEPRVTTIDYVARIGGVTIFAEAKWSERGGLGRCSCLRDDGDPRPGGRCATRVETRDAYWQTAHRYFGLPLLRDALRPCSLSLAYQGVRTVAGARVLADDTPAVFALIFDRNNPYFCRTGKWPGWPNLLSSTLRQQPSSLLFRAISWQRLISLIPLPRDVRQWAREKHGLR